MIEAAPVAVVTTTSPDGTRAVGGALAAVVRPGDIVVLAGDLGAGKTTFAQGFAAALGVREPVTSPTFALVRPYRCRMGGAGGVRTILHADVYRLDRLAEVADLGLAQLVEDEAVALVEWGDVAVPVLGGDVLQVRLDPGSGDGERLVTVTALGPGWAARAATVRAAARGPATGTTSGKSGKSGEEGQ